MQLVRQSDGRAVALESTSIGRGGEARIIGVIGKDLVAKVYHQPLPSHAHKLAAMLANPPADPGASHGQPSIAWPVDLLKGAVTGHIAGFLMPRVANCKPVFHYYNPVLRLRHCPLFNYLYLHRTARNLAAAVHSVHARGYVIGDVNESNVMVAETALVTLVDTDSFQVLGTSQDGGAPRPVVYRCPVGKEEYTPPELRGKNFGQVVRTPEHDLFGLAVLIFQLLMEGVHPFAGSYTGESPRTGERIAKNLFPYDKRPPCQPPSSALPYNILHPQLQTMFIQCFEEGHANPKARPQAAQWQNAIQEVEKRL